MWVLPFIFVSLVSVVTSQHCPSDEPGLASFGDEFSEIEADENVDITTPTLLNVGSVRVNKITISGNGKLVFAQGISITIETKGILVSGNGALIIGNETCRHEDEVNIILKGQRTEDRTILGPEGEKYIAVTDNGVLQIYGPEKRPWTKLSETVERFTHGQSASKVIFNHATSSNAGLHPGLRGLMVYKFDSSTFSPTYFGLLALGRKNVAKEERVVNQFINDVINEIQDGEIVAIAVNNEMRSDANLSTLYSALETAAGLQENSLFLWDSEAYDAFSLAFVKGGMADQSVDKMLGKNVAKATATVIHGGRKVSAISNTVYRSRKLSPDFRILDADIGFPTVRVVHNISSWNVGQFTSFLPDNNILDWSNFKAFAEDTLNVAQMIEFVFERLENIVGRGENAGDEVLLTSTDYAWHHGEVRTILDKEDDHTIRLLDELEYRHYGEIEDGVDMRGEVALLSRNIKIHGEMLRDCPSTNGNCDRYNYDTYGGQLKVFNTFGSIHIEGAEFINMGQTQDKGNYPIHFHMCRNITGKEAIIKHNSIHDSYARCVTVHGTFGSSKTDLGVQVIGNVGHNIMGHCFFLEDGAEMATSLVDNLGAGIKGAHNGFVTDRNKPTVYWITNPQVILRGNVAAGSVGFGIWYTFPLEPVGPSKGLVYRFEEAKHTPIWDFDNNIVHSNELGGMNFDNILDDDNGTVVACMQYYPVVDPLNPSSDSMKVQFTRLTAYKNRQINCWLRGGWFEMMQFASADSQKGLQFARGSNQQMFVKKSVFIGKSKNFEDDDYPDAVTDADLKQYLGVVFHDGPTYVQTSWFKSFKPCTDDSCVAAALGFATKNKFTSSVVSNVTDVRFAFTDPDEGNRVFDGVVDQTSLGIANFDGDETATFRDADGSVTQCPADLGWSYPVQVVTPEKYLLTDQCTYRENWSLAICRSKYGKLTTRSLNRWSGSNMEFDKSGSMKRLNFNDLADVAVEEHPDLHTSEYMVLLGDSRYYYQFQFTNEFPQDAAFEGRGVERDADVVVGFCLPEGTMKDDMSLFFKSPNNVAHGDKQFVYVDSLAEVMSDQHMRRVFLDERFLYFKINSWKVRNEPWDRHDTDHCPGDFCPRFRIIMKKQLPYTPCFTPTEDELSNVAALAGTTREKCNQVSMSPDPDWGVGDTFASQDGQWGDWTGWTDCCNDGITVQTTTRYRLCDNPPKLGGGSDCVGESTESKDCETPCPVDGVIGNWTNWSECMCEGSGEGSQGARFRTRPCVGTANGGEYCSMATENVGPCRGNCFAEPLENSVDGVRTEWAEWSDCFCNGIASGSTGVKTRSRSCEGTANGGRYCHGMMEEVRHCIGDCGYD